MTTTLAAVLHALDQPLRLELLAVPDLRPGQVLVEVACSGVCGTQLHEARGRRGPDPWLPHALGHEGAGTVLAAADDVRKVRPGDRVVLSWIAGSGAGAGGTVYQGEAGPVNSGPLATFMTRTVTCENRVTPIPDDLPFREAALLGCAIPTGAGVVVNSAELPDGGSLAIFGAGGVGLSAVMGGVLRGAGTIIAIDLVPAKLEQARALGATHTINAAEEDPVARVRELTGGGADTTIEAVGRPETMEAALRAARERGGLCILAGNAPHGQRLSVDPFDLIRGRRLAGTWGGESQPDRDLPRYIEAWREGRLNLGALVSHTYPLREVNQALDDLEQGRTLRPLLDCREEPA